MQRKARKVQTTAISLGNPRPQFVSLVKGGANMTPITSLKADLQPGATPGEATNNEAGMTTESNQDYEIVKLSFAAKSFASEDAVTVWLTAGGYEDYKITKTDDGFDVVDAGSDFTGIDPASVVTVQTKDGVSVQVLTPETVATKFDSPHLAQKFESWCAGYTNESTLQGALESGFDGIPPGLAEVFSAFVGALRNNIVEANDAGIRAVCGELAEISIKLAALFPNPATNAAEKDEAVAVKATTLRTGLADLFVAALKADSSGDQPKKNGKLKKVSGKPDMPENEGGTAKTDATLPAAQTTAKPSGSIDKTTEIKPVGQQGETQLTGVTGGTVDPPQGQEGNAQAEGTDKGKPPEEGEEQTSDAQAKGTVSGGGAPEGTQRDAQAAGTASGTGAATGGTTRDVQTHGTTTGAEVPQGTTRDVQKTEDGVVGVALATLADSMTKMTQAMTDFTAAHKSEMAALATRVESVENGGRQSRKGADSTDVGASSQAKSSEPTEDQKRKKAEFREITNAGILGIRRQI